MDDFFKISTIFDGWGTEIVGGLIVLIAGFLGCKRYKKYKIKQKQKGGKNSVLRQEIKDSTDKDISQSQKAGDNSNLIQI